MVKQTSFLLLYFFLSVCLSFYFSISLSLFFLASLLIIILVSILLSIYFFLFSFFFFFFFFWLTGKEWIIWEFSILNRQPNALQFYRHLKVLVINHSHNIPIRNCKSCCKFLDIWIERCIKESLTWTNSTTVPWFIAGIRIWFWIRFRNGAGENRRISLAEEPHKSLPVNKRSWIDALHLFNANICRRRLSVASDWKNGVRLER